MESRVVGVRAFRPEIIYQYRVKDKTLSASTDLNTPGFGNRRYRRITAERIINMYPAGSPVRSGPYWSDFMQLALSIVCLVSGGIVIANILFIRWYS